MSRRTASSTPWRFLSALPRSRTSGTWRGAVSQCSLRARFSRSRHTWDSARSGNGPRGCQVPFPKKQPAPYRHALPGGFSPVSRALRFLALCLPAHEDPGSHSDRPVALVIRVPQDEVPCRPQSVSSPGTMSRVRRSQQGRCHCMRRMWRRAAPRHSLISSMFEDAARSRQWRLSSMHLTGSRARGE